jgi:hypothetical protein
VRGSTVPLFVPINGQAAKAARQFDLNSSLPSAVGPLGGERPAGTIGHLRPFTVRRYSRP